MNQILPIVVFSAIAALAAVGLLLLGRLLGPKRRNPVKAMPYESGMDPFHDARKRFDVRFYLVAIAFLVFDVELLFLYPWAVASRDRSGIDAVKQRLPLSVEYDRWLVFGEVMVFLALLTVGLVYAWRRGVLRWR